MAHLFLTGYEKETLEDFLDKLKQEGITAVIDVREVPLSRKNSFSKETLKEELAKNKIKYYHFPELGSPTELRDRLRETSDYLNFFRGYREYVTKKRGSIVKLIKLVISNGESSALLCVERHSDLCHRSIIASEILKINQNIRITPL